MTGGVIGRYTQDMTKQEQQQRVSELASKMQRTITAKKVVGAGGRLRTVYECEAHCWHGSSGQARKCKNAHWIVAGDAFRQDP